MVTAVQPKAKPAPYTVVGQYPCGFCNNGFHENCVGATKNGQNAPSKVIVCGCAQEGCGSTKLRCLDCNTRIIDYIDPAYWRCVEQAECMLRQQQYLDNDPLVQSIRKIKESSMAKAETEKKPAAPKAPTTGTCLVTGKPTKGGKFAPGQDAKYVSIKVAAVVAGKTTEADVLKEMTGHGLSDALKAKFQKSVGLALARKEAAETAAREKAAEKASA